MNTVFKIILAITTTGAGLIAGLLYAYSVSVNLGLSQLNSSSYLLAMQNINKAISNPLFFISFMGTAILLPICTWLAFTKSIDSPFWLLLSATILYLIGVLGVTILGNVPLNETLASFNISDASKEIIESHRIQFEKPWNDFHLIRTVTSIISFALAVFACLNLKHE